MLVLDAGPRPPTRPVELDHQAPAVPIGQFVDPVDVAVVGAAQIGAAHPEGRFGQVENERRGQAVKGGLAVTGRFRVHGFCPFCGMRSVAHGRVRIRNSLNRPAFML